MKNFFDDILVFLLPRKNLQFFRTARLRLLECTGAKQRVQESLLFFLYPTVCSICGRIDKNSLCTKCNKKIKNITKYRLIVHKNKYYDKQLYVFKYE